MYEQKYYKHLWLNMRKYLLRQMFPKVIPDATSPSLTEIIVLKVHILML